MYGIAEKQCTEWIPLLRALLRHDNTDRRKELKDWRRPNCSKETAQAIECVKKITLD